MALAEFEILLDEGEVIEETSVEKGVKELVLVMEWSRPLHVVLVVDDIREEQRIVTVYEPDEDRWSPDFKVRMR